MAKPLLFAVFIIPALLFITPIVAQSGKDTFFLSRKKGLLGKLGRSIATDGIARSPEKSVNLYKRFNGKIIRSIEVSRIGLERTDVGDTSSRTFILKVAQTFHRTTTEHVIRNNLFFREGEKLSPLLVADNERFLRDQTFLRDAWIVVKNTAGTADSVDVIVITRDVFSIGGSLSISSSDRARLEIREENIGGTGNKFTVSAIYDKLRNPNLGLGAELIKRNIKGSFLNWATGFNSFNSAFNSGRYEESRYYTSIEKPFISRYTDWTGEVILSYNRTFNAYLPDSFYLSDFRYKYLNGDVWGGYQFGYRSGRAADAENRYRHFVGVRTFYTHFYENPQKYDTIYNAGYADINGVLASYTLFRQNFYRTNFIYGFGRNEDVPEGTTATLVGGLTNKEGVRRAYYGFEGSITRYQRNRSFNSYTLMIGGFTNKGKIQDVNIIGGVDNFSKLNRMSKYWLNRNFAALYLSGQVKPFLNQPLLLHSKYGLPYFRTDTTLADVRATVKLESVFYNLTSYLGFRFAPFIFGDVSFLKPISEEITRTVTFGAIGGGIRTRNENLVFGTIELRGYYFPRTVNGMKNWKIDLNTKVIFKYNSTFIRRPDFVLSN